MKYIICQNVDDALIIKGSAETISQVKEVIAALVQDGWAQMGPFIVLETVKID